ncbi:MAG: flagellar biosynthesis regulator FlaF [Alphaproteobacteria bacterium]|jgi:flagellar protein FlaF|nr:flagellar biosynthesis regulator FlaF [Alphaproteobacteria bacterium]
MSTRPPSKPAAHGKASANYGARAKAFAGGRELEAQALLKAARMLQDLQNNWDKRTAGGIEETLKFNRQIWVLFYDNAQQPNTAANVPVAPPLRTNIINLASFVFKRSVDILADPAQDKLSILININREVAAGLMTHPLSVPDSDLSSA